MDVKKLISYVPDFEVFCTVAELDQWSEELASRYPLDAKRFSIGNSRQGHPIQCPKIGNGSRSAVCFACPHPNEPIGSLTLMSLAGILLEDEESRTAADMTWYLIPCIDPDGTRLNEAWFKGPFSLESYVRGFYRPPGREQIEWTFPFTYGDFVFDEPLPETRALMRLIEQVRPALVYSLHNLAFGGAYWYLSKNIQPLCELFELEAADAGIPLHLGEPESPYIEKLSPAVHSMMSLHKYFCFLEEKGQLGNIPPLKSGTCSGDFVDSICDSLVLMTEVPYFVDRRIEDTSLCDLTLTEVRREKRRRQNKHYEFLSALWSRLEPFFSPDNPFPLLVRDMMQSHEIQPELAEPLDSVKLHQPATVAEKVDGLLLSQIFELLNLGLTIRACNFELERKQEPHATDILESAIASLNRVLIAESKKLEADTAYEIVPIRQLVQVQLASVLHAVKFAHEVKV